MTSACSCSVVEEYQPHRSDPLHPDVSMHPSLNHSVCRMEAGVKRGRVLAENRGLSLLPTAFSSSGPQFPHLLCSRDNTFIKGLLRRSK